MTQIYNITHPIELTQLFNNNKNNDMNCLSCNYNSTCSKDCPSRNIIINNNLYTCNEVYCQCLNLEYQIALDLINQLSKNHNFLFKLYFQSILKEDYNYD